MVYWESTTQVPVPGRAGRGRDVASQPSSGGIKPLVAPLSVQVNFKRSKSGDTNKTLSQNIHVRERRHAVFDHFSRISQPYQCCHPACAV